MTTQKVLQVTDKGEIKYIAEYPDAADFVDQADDRSSYDSEGFKEAEKKALLTGIAVNNEMVAANNLAQYHCLTIVITDGKPEWKYVTKGIYPYNGEVKEKWECKINGKWFDCLGATESDIKNGFKRKVAILVEPNTPEKPDSSELCEAVKQNGEKALQLYEENEQLRTRNLQLRSEYDDLFKSFTESKSSNKELVEALKGWVRLKSILVYDDSTPMPESIHNEYEAIQLALNTSENLISKYDKKTY